MRGQILSGVAAVLMGLATVAVWTVGLGPLALRPIELAVVALVQAFVSPVGWWTLSGVPTGLEVTAIGFAWLLWRPPSTPADALWPIALVLETVVVVAWAAVLGSYVRRRRGLASVALG